MSGVFSSYAIPDPIDISKYDTDSARDAFATQKDLFQWVLDSRELVLQLVDGYKRTQENLNEIATTYATVHSAERFQRQLTELVNGITDAVTDNETKTEKEITNVRDKITTIETKLAALSPLTPPLVPPPATTTPLVSPPSASTSVTNLKRTVGDLEKKIDEVQDDQTKFTTDIEEYVTDIEAKVDAQISTLQRTVGALEYRTAPPPPAPTPLTNNALAFLPDSYATAIRNGTIAKLGIPELFGNPAFDADAFLYLAMDAVAANQGAVRAAPPRIEVIEKALIRCKARTGMDINSRLCACKLDVFISACTDVCSNDAHHYQMVHEALWALNTVANTDGPEDAVQATIRALCGGLTGGAPSELLLSLQQTTPHAMGHTCNAVVLDTWYTLRLCLSLGGAHALHRTSSTSYNLPDAAHTAACAFAPDVSFAYPFVDRPPLAGPRTYVVQNSQLLMPLSILKALRETATRGPRLPLLEGVDRQPSLSGIVHGALVGDARCADSIFNIVKSGLTATGEFGGLQKQRANEMQYVDRLADAVAWHQQWASTQTHTQRVCSYMQETHTLDREEYLETTLRDMCAPLDIIAYGKPVAYALAPSRERAPINAHALQTWHLLMMCFSAAAALRVASIESGAGHVITHDTDKLETLFKTTFI